MTNQEPRTITWHGLKLTLLYHEYGIHADNWAYVPTPRGSENPLFRGDQYPYVARAGIDSDPRPWEAVARVGVPAGRGWTEEEACEAADRALAEADREIARVNRISHHYPYTINLGGTEHSVGGATASRLFVALLRCFQEKSPWSSEHYPIQDEAVERAREFVRTFARPGAAGEAGS